MSDWRPPIAEQTHRYPWEYISRSFEIETDRDFETVGYLKIIKFGGQMGRIVPGQTWRFSTNTNWRFNGKQLFAETRTKELTVKKAQDIEYLVVCVCGGESRFFCPTSTRSIKGLLDFLKGEMSKQRMAKNQIWR